MREVTVSKIISADREPIFDFVSDLAGRPRTPTTTCATTGSRA